MIASLSSEVYMQRHQTMLNAFMGPDLRVDHRLRAQVYI